MESDKSAIHADWEHQKLVAMYGAVDKAGEALTQYIIPGITRVVDTVTGRTALVHQIMPKFGVQVWSKERGQERENWSWAMITVRQPRSLKRYPRPFRWPREEPTQQCHCRIGKMEVENVEEAKVRCQRCKQLVGTESYPRRIERAEIALRSADRKLKAQSKSQVQKRVRQRPVRKAVHRSKTSVKARRKSPSRVVVRHKGRTNAKASTGKTRKRASLPTHRKVSKNRKVSALHKKVGAKARSTKRRRVK